MLLVRATRRLLRRGGIPVVERVADFRSSHPAWIALHGRIASGQGTVEESIRFGRLLLYLNFVDDARALAASARATASNPSERLWLDYIDVLAQSLSATRTYDIAGLSAALSDESAIPAGPLRFHVALFLAAHHQRTSFDPQSSARWLDVAARSIEGSAIADDALVSRIANARLARHLAGLQDGVGDVRSAEASLDLALEEIADCPDEAHFLAAETTRRIHAFRATLRLRHADARGALEAARRAVVLDPSCPHALSLAGECAARAGYRLEAIRHFARADHAGVIERPHARHALALLTSRQRRPAATELVLAAAGDARACFAESLAGDRDRDQALSASQHAAPGARSRRAWLARERIGAAALPRPPMTVAHADALADGPFDDERLLRRSETYFRLRPFWELASSEGAEAPRMSLSPLIAWRCHREARDPFLQPISAQRAPLADFREAMLAQAIGGARLVGPSGSAAASLASLAGLRGEAVLVARLYENARDLPVLDRARLARVLGGLGFIHEACEVSAPEQRGRFDSADEEYMASTHLFFDSLVHDSGPGPFQELLKVTYDAMKPAAHNVRIRLVLAIHGVVRAAKDRDAASVKAWVPAAKATLEEVRASRDFSDFDRLVLESRTYRATAFLPFLERDHRMLLREMTHCMDLARSAVPTSAVERELSKDNLYACIESMARTRIALNYSEAVSTLYEELTTLDPFDAHAWLQRGDLLEQRNDHRAALDCFLRAARFGPPQTGVCLHRAGLAARRLGDLELALACFLRAVWIAPGAVPTLLQIVAVAKRLNDGYVASWAAQLLGALDQRGALAESHVARLVSLLGGHPLPVSAAGAA
jgi:tetratricopeptide (TPR) repeat protein